MKQLNNKEKHLFCTQLETVVSSGMSMSEGLYLICDDENENIAAVAKSIRDKIEDNVPLTEAIESEESLDSYFTRMIKIADINGKLDTVLNELAKYYERQDYLQRKIKEAITYPLILLWMMFAILLVLVFKILPIFSNIMDKMGASYNGVALIISKIANVLVVVCLIALGIITIASIVYFIYMRISKDENTNERLLSKLPITSKLYRTIGISKFTYSLSLFVHSGYPLEEAIGYIENISNDEGLNKKIQNIKDNIADGGSFADSVIAEDIYDNNIKGLLRVGLKSGKQDVTFDKLVDIFDEQITEETSTFLNIIEPIVIAVLSFVVGIVLISLMLPLISIMGSLA